MNETIEFARELPLDMMKFGVTIAFPGTKMFNDYLHKKLVRSFDWDDYFIYTDEPLFAHARLSYETISKYMRYAYRRAILTNPGFILRRILRGFRTGEFFWDLYYGFKFITMPSVTNTTTKYYARERWPTHDFDAAPPAPAQYQIVKKTIPARAPAETTAHVV